MKKTILNPVVLFLMAFTMLSVQCQGAGNETTEKNYPT